MTRPGGPGSPRAARLDRYRRARRAASPRTSPRAFEALVAEALDKLPAFVRGRMHNLAVVVEDRPLNGQSQHLGLAADQDLLGLYEGTPHHERFSGYHLAVPDRISIYRHPILQQTRGLGRSALVREVQATVIHEVAHHFGFTDEELERLERRRRR